MDLLDAEASSLELAGGAVVRVVSGGSGAPPVVFDSALGTPLEAWGLVAPATAERVRVLLWDRPGIGKSSDDPPLTISGVIEAVARIVDRVSDGPVIAVGHSRGGLHMLCLALSRPDLVRGLVLVYPSHPEQDLRMTTGDDPLLRAVSILAGAPAPVGVIPAMGVQLVGRVLGRRISPGARLMAELAPAMAGRARGLAAENAAGPALLAEAREIVATNPRLAMPATVITASKNYRDPAQQSTWEQLHAQLVALSDDGRHVRIDCGHDVPFARPDIVHDAIIGMANRLTERS